MKENASEPILHRTGSVIALLSAVFLSAGFIHLSVLYGSFGISVSQYFLLSDYVACSIEQIYHAVWGAVGVGIGYIFATFPMEPKNKSTHPDEFRGVYLVVLCTGTSLFILSAGYLTICLQSFFFDIGLLTYPQITKQAIFIIGATAVIALTVKFQRWTPLTMILVLASLFFFTSLIVNTFKNIEEIKAGTLTDRFTIQVGDQTFSEQYSQIIGSNSRFMFLYMADQTTIIIPLSQISSVSIRDT